MEKKGDADAFDFVAFCQDNKKSVRNIDKI